ncbi:MAG: SDR family oxidoreductase [Acidimicrobiales bacterium]
MTMTTDQHGHQEHRAGSDTGLDVVTGAFSYTGKAIAAALIGSGRQVRTITGHPGRALQNSPLGIRPLDFDDPVGLVTSLSGATTLYNTYWVRFAHDRTNHEQAVANPRTLFHAARRAGVQRIVHVSITNPSIGSPFPYFRGKALVERALAEIDAPATASTALSGWLGEHSSGLGLHYANELHRHFRASPPASAVRASPDRLCPTAGVE